MKNCIVSYFPSTNQIICIYTSIEEARKDVRMLNVFNGGGREKLSIGIAELTDEEYDEIFCQNIWQKEPPKEEE